MRNTWASNVSSSHPLILFFVLSLGVTPNFAWNPSSPFPGMSGIIYTRIHICMYVCMLWYGMVWYGMVCMYVYIYKKPELVSLMPGRPRQFQKVWQGQGFQKDLLQEVHATKNSQERQAHQAAERLRRSRTSRKATGDTHPEGPNP